MTGFPEYIRRDVKSSISSAMMRKMEGFNPETKYMPFHTRLLGADRMHLYSFIQSLNTNFGSAIFEPVAATIATNRFSVVDTQYELDDEINVGARSEIDSIVGDLTAALYDPDALAERRRVKEAMLTTSDSASARDVKVDLRLVGHDGMVHLIDLKTVKPNRGGIVGYKRQILNWFAKESRRFPEAEIRTAIALPYNPYHPEPYRRWTFRGMMDLSHDVYVAEDFWNFLAGDDIYDDLLDCFQEVGMELRDEIDDYFRRYGNEGARITLDQSMTSL